ncbi:hypothetical protein GFS60_04529 [Rhodococcus sp. WAY2]|nr:hypothetical protein GFS60_04529 [Rhodococcus sp. WAY2]
MAVELASGNGRCNEKPFKTRDCRSRQIVELPTARIIARHR